MYGGMIDAFSRAIGRLGKRNRQLYRRGQSWQSALWGDLGVCCICSRENYTIHDTRNANERATYCIIHQLFPITTLRLMPFR